MVLALAVALCLSGSPCSADAETPECWKAGFPFDGPVQVPGEPEGQYWLQLPPDISADKACPLILFFPGRMYGKTPNQTNWLKPEFTKLRQRCRERGYIVCSVGRLTDMWMNERSRELVDICLAHVKANLPVDENRIYAAGLSMGGGGALTYAKFRPKIIKGVCNLMGCTDFRKFYETGHYNESLSGAFGGSPDEAPDMYAAQSAVTDPEVYRAIPIITIHGAKDACIPVWNAQEFWAKIVGFGNGSQCVIRESMGHTNEIVLGLEDRILDVFDKALR